MKLSTLIKKCKFDSVNSSITDKNMKKEDKIILHLCADTGSDSKPYADNGYKVVKIGKNIGVENYRPDRFIWIKDVYGIIANPPCTEFSIARTGGKARNPEKGIEYALEN